MDIQREEEKSKNISNITMKSRMIKIGRLNWAIVVPFWADVSIRNRTRKITRKRL